MSLFRALKYKNYRLFFIGQSISLVGTWMQHLAMAWLVYRITGSAFWLGVVGFAGHIPNLLFAPVAGVLADRWNRVKILHLTQALSLWQAAILALLTLGGVVELWHVIALAAILGLINAVDIPTRQSFFVELIDNKNDIGNAIALNSSMFNFARLLGPALAGILIAFYGEGVCFLVNVFTFIPIMVALFLMKLSKRKKSRKDVAVWNGLKEGIAYIRKFSPIQEMLLLMGFIGLFGMPFTILLPVFASEILNGGSETYGMLAASMGCGALAGALSMASKKNVLGFEKIIAFSAALFCMGVIVFSQMNGLISSLVVLFIIGFGLMMQMASTNTVLQTIVDDDKRGRVMSFYSISIIGTAPFGNLMVGALASRLGVSFALVVCGIVCSLGVLFFARQLSAIRKRMQPHYVRMGILPEVASALDQATSLQNAED